MSIFNQSRVNRRAFLTGLAATAALPVTAAQPLTVVATTGMIGDLAQVIGGADVSVRSLMGPGVDPHSYRQTRSDIVAMTRADLVLWHGLYLEAQMERFLLDLAGRKPVLAVADALPRAALRAHEDYDDHFDPHVWMDVDLWQQCAETVCAALVAAVPEAEGRFNANLAAFRAEADALGVYAAQMLTRVPADQRVLVTAHDAFGYFGQAHGFEVLGIQGISTESEAGLNRVGELASLLAERKIKAVFVESSVSDRNIRALIEGAAAQGHNVQIGGSLFSDAMGAPGTYEGTWLGMMDHNVTTIAAALGATPPAAGRLGKLGS